MEEHLVKRTIWTAKCDCGELDITYQKIPPREVLCPKCGQWIKPEEQTWTGPAVIGEK